MSRKKWNKKNGYKQDYNVEAEIVEGAGVKIVKRRPSEIYYRN